MRLWIAGRDGHGALVVWPDDGGMAQQSAWVFDAFGILASADAAMRKAEKGAGA